MINIWLLYDYFTTVLFYIYNVLSFLVLLTRKIGIGLIDLFSPKVLFKFKAVLKVVRFWYSVMFPAVFQVYGRVWRGNVRLAGGTK